MVIEELVMATKSWVTSLLREVGPWFSAASEAIAEPEIISSSRVDCNASSTVGLSMTIKLSKVGLVTQSGGDSVSAYPD